MRTVLSSILAAVLILSLSGCPPPEDEPEETGYTLTIAVVGDGTVTVTPDRLLYEPDTVVTLLAQSDPGWTFEGWGGDLYDSEPGQSLLMDSDKTVTASFRQESYWVETWRLGYGTVLRDPEPDAYHYGDEVQLTAIPDTGYTFGAWLGDLSGSDNPAILTVTGDMSVTAAFSGPEGELLWSRQIRPNYSPASSGPAVGPDGTIYVGGLDFYAPDFFGRLYALFPDGDTRWRYEPPAQYVRSSPVLADNGRIYVGASNGCLYALHSTGTMEWYFPAWQEITSTPAIGADGTVYVGSNDRRLYAVNPDGSKQWEFMTGSRISSSPAVATDGTIYVGSGDFNLYAVNPENGSQKWAFPTGGEVTSSPAIGADGTIYVGSSDDSLYAINPEDGTQKWAFPTTGRVISSPVIGTDGTIYVGSEDYSLYAVNPEDGSQKWAFPTGDAVYSDPAVGADGVIYVGSNDGRLYAINADGSERWSYLTGGNVQSPVAIGTAGVIYAGSTDGRLYAIHSSSGELADSPWPMFHQNAQHTGRQPAAE